MLKNQHNLIGYQGQCFKTGVNEKIFQIFLFVDLQYCINLLYSKVIQLCIYVCVYIYIYTSFKNIISHYGLT